MKLAKRHFLNYSIFIPYLLLSAIGLVMVYSTTSAHQIVYGEDPLGLVRSQVLYSVLSLVAIWLVYRMKLVHLRQRKLVLLALFVNLILLGATRLFPRINGAYGWIPLPGLGSLQPAEYIKLVLIWYLAQEFARIQQQIATYDYQALTQGTWLPREFRDWRVFCGLILTLVISLPDLGNAAILVLIILSMLCISGIAHRWFIVALGIIGSISTVVLGLTFLLGVEVMEKIPVFGYVPRRFSAFFDPFANPTAAGLQLTHSYYAMSNGGWFGRGLGNSIEKNGYLPEAHTDFAFSIVIEELGFVGASLILGLLFFLIIRIILVGLRARNPFNAMVCLGVATLFLIQVFVNVGGISGLIPATGVTFPFLSQGGSSLLILSIGIAFVLNIDAYEKRQQFEEDLERTLF